MARVVRKSPSRPPFGMGQALALFSPAAVRVRVMARDNYTCVYCNKAPATELDHVFPQSRGGATSDLNTVASCRNCNRRKGARTPQEWRRAQAVERLMAGRRLAGAPGSGSVPGRREEIRQTILKAASSPPARRYPSQ
jgi:hypothetical protein